MAPTDPPPPGLPGSVACQIFLRVLDSSRYILDSFRYIYPGAPSFPPLAARALPQTRPKVAGTVAVGRQNAGFYRFWADFWPIRNPSKIGLLQKPPKIAQNRPRSAQGFIFNGFWMPFGLHFPSVFATRRTLLKCNKHRARALFYHLRASHFGIGFQSKFHVFSGTPPGPSFFAFYVDFIPKFAGPLAHGRVRSL